MEGTELDPALCALEEEEQQYLAEAMAESSEDDEEALTLEDLVEEFNDIKVFSSIEYLNWLNLLFLAEGLHI